MMDVLTKDLLVNFLLMILPLLFIQIVYFYSYRQRLESSKEWLAALFPAVSIVLCMLFPFSVNEGFLWDLRGVPLIIGALYGGYRMAFFLIGVMLISRIMIGGDGVLVITYTLLLMCILLPFAVKYFRSSSILVKTTVSCILVTVFVLSNALLAFILFDVEMSLFIWMEYIFINIIGMILAIILWEIIRTNFVILNDLIKAEKLAVISHLAASISHEVRNPLTVSKGFIQMAIQQQNNRETSDYLSTALKEIDRATDIINDYLTFAKPAPEQQMHVRITEEITQSINVMKPLANMNNVVIHHVLTLPTDRLVKTEPKKFKQCMINIIKNGIEAMPDGGNLYINCGLESEHVVINIRDEGQGMKKEEINRLGEPYFSTKNKGTGLGLMVSYSIIRALNGQIDVTSEPDKGTEFIITLPIHDEAPHE
ncbi:ATP-binding protein [Jeotgalibacillus sp. R-1-5s-1]|uniref:ATP-binding protein n=1 Tax=Jeotgalibacillus sp. R-1-5s-1 TaxID=2555897 RepID=UPI00106A0AC0|nr:ATP-binding protein [Jeotgalibacillus sp. R-1-5s-1]TFD97569.1 two-component sensor histidine kinase [Jeotgalibacillus sp. R-1-5s-1]